MHSVKVTNLSKSTKFSTFSNILPPAKPTVFLVLAGYAGQQESQRPCWNACCTQMAVNYSSSIKTGKFGPKVLQIVDILTGRVILNSYGRSQNHQTNTRKSKSSKHIWYCLFVSSIELHRNLCANKAHLAESSQEAISREKLISSQPDF